MAINSYTALQQSVADWLNRDDLTSQIKDFIRLAEAKIHRKVRRKTIRTTVSASTETTTLPADCGEVRSVVPKTGTPRMDRPLAKVMMTMLADINARVAGVPGRPQAYAIIDGKLVLAPVPDKAYNLDVLYFEALDPLSSTTASNSVLDEAPDIYLYGALCESEPFLEHDERVALWKGLRDEAIDDLDTVRQREETQALLVKPRLPVCFG